MALVADTGALYALYDADDLHHAAVRQVVEGERGPIILPVVILAELDYLLREFLGVKAELAGQDPPEVWTEGRNAHRKSILNANQSKRSTERWQPL